METLKDMELLRDPTPWIALGETQPKTCPLSPPARAALRKALPSPPRLLWEAQHSREMLEWERAFHLKHNPEERERTLASSWLDL